MGAVTLFHGLPSDHVRAIAQGSDGTMWFGTDGGLVKYDGRRIQKLAGDGPASSRVLALNLDREGVLWIGSAAGAARLINGEIKPIAETKESAITAINNSETGRALMTSDQGEIFDCSVAQDGSLSVRKIEPSDHPLLRIESRDNAPLRLTSLALVDNRMIVGTRSRGLIAIDANQMKAGATRTSDLVKEVLSRPRSFFVDAIQTDAGGNLWIGTETSGEDAGLFNASDLMRPAKIGAGTGTVTAIKSESGGDLWIGTEARGAFRIRDGRKLEQFTFESTGGGLLSNHIYSVFVDREGVLWFGTDRGVCRYDPQALRAETISSDAESNFARVLFQTSDGVLWCGTNRGLFAHNPDASSNDVPELKGKVIHSLAEDNRGRLLVGSASGLYSGDKLATKRSATDQVGGREFSRIEPDNAAAGNIRAITTFRGVTYVANFGRGIERLEGATRTLVWPDESSSAIEREVVSLHADGDQLWIGTAQAGVFRFDGRQITVDHVLDELIGAAVWSIAGSSERVLWLASARALYALKSGELIRVIEGVDARNVLARADGSVWCGTLGGGLQRAALYENETIITSRIDSEQGLPSQSVFSVMQSRAQSSARGSDETIWIGTSRGVARYEPSAARPTITVTRAMARRSYTIEDLRDGLKLDYPQNGFSLDVAAVSSRTFPEQFQYAFLVSDEGGRPVSKKLSGESQLLIESLRPGRYRVEVRAFSSDLIASEPLALEVLVASAPFPWTSTLLSLLLALALVALWWGLHQNKRLVGTNRQLVETRTQLASETERERRRIARDLHDQTLSDLRRLMLLMDQLPATETHNGHVKPSQIREEIESVSTEIRRICEDLSPSALANVGLGAALEWALADAVVHQPAEKKFEYEFICDGDLDEKLELAAADQIQIYRIVQEAVSNTSRHSGATRVKLAVAIDAKGELLIRVEDNGCGFDAAKQGKRGRGLANIRSRASLIEAEVTWARASEGGTTFLLRKRQSRSTD